MSTRHLVSQGQIKTVTAGGDDYNNDVLAVIFTNLETMVLGGCELKLNCALALHWHQLYTTTHRPTFGTAREHRGVFW